MTRNIKAFAILFTGSMLLSTSVFAVAPLACGWYLDVNGGSSLAQGKSYNVASVKRTGFAWGGSVGYKFMPYFGVEGGYIRYADTLLKAPVGGTVARDRHYSYQVAGKAMFPVGCTGLEFFGKLGVNRVNSKIGNVSTSLARTYGYTFNTNSNNATGLFASAGVDYSFMPYFQTNLAWTRAQGNSSTGSLEYYSLGFTYILW